MTDDTLTFDLDQLRIRAEQQARNFDTFAKDIARGCGPLLGEASRLAFAASEILVQAAQVDAGRQAVTLFTEPTAMEATVPPCRCGHDRARHDPDQCRDCPGDEERTWRHPYSPEPAPAEDADAAPVLSSRDAVMDALHARIPNRDGHRADLDLWNDRDAMAARILAALGITDPR